MIEENSEHTVETLYGDLTGRLLELRQFLPPNNDSWFALDAKLQQLRLSDKSNFQKHYLEFIDVWAPIQSLIDEEYGHSPAKMMAFGIGLSIAILGLFFLTMTMPSGFVLFALGAAMAGLSAYFYPPKLAKYDHQIKGEIKFFIKRCAQEVFPDQDFSSLNFIK